MAFARPILFLSVLAAACGSTDHTPTPQPTAVSETMTGSVSATNDGVGVQGLTVTSEGKVAATGANGAFALPIPADVQHQINVTGEGIIPRTVYARGKTATVDVIRLDPALGLTAEYYRQLVRDSLESPLTLSYVRRWNVSPRIYVRTVNEANQPMDQRLIDFTVNVIRESVPQWTDGRLSVAEVQQGTDTRVGTTGWVTILWPSPVEQGICGRANIALNGGTIWLNYLNAPCGCNGLAVRAATIRHEIGHAMGFWHTNKTDDLMYGQGFSGCDRLPTPLERAVAAIAYRRPYGNIEPDTDPSSEVLTHIGPSPIRP